MLIDRLTCVKAAKMVGGERKRRGEEHGVPERGVGRKASPRAVLLFGCSISFVFPVPQPPSRTGLLWLCGIGMTPFSLLGHRGIWFPTPSSSSRHPQSKAPVGKGLLQLRVRFLPSHPVFPIPR